MLERPRGKKLSRRRYEITSEKHPREGINALDAAFSAYSSISMLRQQIRPDHRVHGVLHGKDWLPNGIFFFFLLLGQILS